MRVLVITEKPSLANAIQASIVRVDPWPGADVDIICTFMTGWWTFDWPRHYRWTDLPLLGEPRFRPEPRLSDWFGRVVRLRPGVPPTKDNPFEGLSPEEVDALARSFAHGYDLVVNLTDPWYRGDTEFFRIISGGAVHPGEATLPDCPIIEGRLYSLAVASIDPVIGRLVPGRLDGEQARLWRPDSQGLVSGLAKDRFDYAWWSNALPLFPRLLAAAGAPAEFAEREWVTTSTRTEHRRSSAVALGRNGLMLLGWLAREPYDGPWLGDGEVIQAMEEWKGSGRYQGKPDPIRFGTEASRIPALEHLLSAGLLERLPRREMPFHVPQWVRAVCADTGTTGAALLTALEADCATGRRRPRDEVVAEILNTLCGDGRAFEVTETGWRLAPEFRKVVLHHIPKHSRIFEHDEAWYIEHWLGKFLKDGWDGNPEVGQVYRTIGLLEGKGLASRPTAAGRRLVGLLPKEAWDPDLPWRLSTWCLEGAVAYPRMDAYLQRLFKAIKRAAERADPVALDLPSSWFSEARTAMGWDEAETARRAQVPVAEVRRLEGGEVVSGPTRAALARVLGRG